MPQIQSDESDLTAFQEQMTIHMNAMTEILKTSINEGFTGIRNDIDLHGQMKRENEILGSVRRFLKIIIGEPQSENPTKTMIDENEALKAKLETNHQENHLLKLELERFRREHEELQLSLAAADEESRAHQVSLHKAADDLNAAVASFNTREQEYQKLEGRLAALTHSNSDLVQRLETADHCTGNLRMKLDRYKEIILKNTDASSNQTDDAAIASKFRSLREQIQRLVQRYYTMSNVPPKVNPPASRRAMSLYELWGMGLDDHELQSRVRGFIFKRLSVNILERPCFGLDGHDVAEMEAGFESFETLLRKTTEYPSTEITEWRTATLKCTKILPPHEPKIPMQFAQRLLYFLEPLRIIHPEQAKNDAEFQKLGELWVKLSQDAYNLTLLLRNCKDTFACEFPEKRKPLNIEDTEAMDTERVQNKSSGEGNPELIVAFALSGALVKYPEHDPKERIVLEKAWAVVEG
ncbi:hypothetical protein ACMFMG_000260 [Clarireedia jacksonii]